MEVEHRMLRSPFVARVTRVICRAKRRNVVEPDGTWDFIFRDCATGAGVLQTGQIDRPVELDCEAGDTYFSSRLGARLSLHGRGSLRQDGGHGGNCSRPRFQRAAASLWPAAHSRPRWRSRCSSPRPRELRMHFTKENLIFTGD
jgi:hypothetical protein